MSEMSEWYKWELETDKGTIYQSGNKFNGRIVRASFIPVMKLLPRHDVLFTNDFKYIRRFGRGMIKQEHGMKEYLHCVVTTSFRFYLRSSNGQCLLTTKDYELYL